MRHFAQTAILLPLLAATAVASPLRKEQVAADAKWLVHLDVDKLRSTTVGAMVKQLVDTKLGDLKNQFGIDLDLNKISSLTAYGSEYQTKPNFNGVVLINTELDLQKALDGAIEKMSQMNSNAPPPVQKTHQGEVTTYTIHGAMFVSFQAGKPVIVSHSRASIQKAEEVLSGSSANLASTKTFSEFPDSPKGFFFLGAAQGFNLGPEQDEKAEEGDKDNPKAKILKLADGGQVMLGEEANQLLLDLSLKAKTTEVVTQMQQVIQGMIALASLSQPNNPDLMQLAQSAKVSASGNVVNLQVGYPADKAVQMLNSHINSVTERKKRAEGGEGRHKKHRVRTNSAPDEPSKTDDQ